MKDFVPHKESLQLAELGFDELVFAKYQKMSEGAKYQLQLLAKERNCNILDTAISAPTFLQAFRFFRKKYGLQSYINPELPFSYNNPKYTVIFIKTTKNFVTYKDDTIWVKKDIERKRFNSYEEAELECLRKLIEIVKNAKKD